MDGTLTYESVRGGGTVFVCTLPTASPTEHRPADGSAAPASNAPTPPARRPRSSAGSRRG